MRLTRFWGNSLTSIVYTEREGMNMLVFSTRIPLKSQITQEDCLKVFIDWIIESPHYAIDEIAYDISSHKDFEYSKGTITVSFRHFKNDQIELSACRLENREQNAVWFNDCIFLNEVGKKTLLVQLNCNRTNFNARLPRIHKPYVVRKFVEGGFCGDDAGIPVVDTPLEVEQGFYDTCVDIMKGTHPYSMPAVYISCDYWDNTVLSPTFLAHQLSGIAHVFVEKNHETALKLRDDTGGNNAHTGYIGIYFPGTGYCQKHSLDYYSDFKEMTREIISSVWNALVNRLDASIFNWNQIIALQSRQKMTEWQDISEKDKAQLKAYMDAFDGENESLRTQVAELNQQLYALRGQLDALRASINSGDADSCFYKMGAEPNLYAGERNDLLYSILKQVQNRYDQNSRAYTIIQSLLDANPPIGECARVVNCVREVFGNGAALTKAGKAKLKDAGFTISEEGPHYKMVFHDSRYMFTVSKTPSEHREGKNLVSDICKIIDIDRKI